MKQGRLNYSAVSILFVIACFCQVCHPQPPEATLMERLRPLTQGRVKGEELWKKGAITIDEVIQLLQDGAVLEPARGELMGLMTTYGYERLLPHDGTESELGFWFRSPASKYLNS